MKKDKQKTKVIFLWDKDTEGYTAEVFAFFPEMNYFHYPSETKVCYSHVGQHSACIMEYAAGCAVASPRESSSLRQELEGLGYDLQIVDADHVQELFLMTKN